MFGFHHHRSGGGHFDTAPLQLVGIARGSEVEHLGTLQHRNAVELFHGGKERGVNGYGRDRVFVNASHEVGGDVVAITVINSDGVGFSAFAEAAGDVVKESVVVFRFEHCDGFGIHRHAAVLGAALQLGEEGVVVPSKALSLGGAVLHLGGLFFGAQGERQGCCCELRFEVGETRCLRVQGEQAYEKQNRDDYYFVHGENQFRI